MADKDLDKDQQGNQVDSERSDKDSAQPVQLDPDQQQGGQKPGQQGGQQQGGQKPGQQQGGQKPGQQQGGQQGGQKV